MLKKLSLLLAVVMLCTSIGIIAPVSAQAAETVIVESNFQNCNLGTYTAANQLSGETDLRNGVIMVDDSDLTTGYTIKKGDSYESISEADIVNDGGVKVLRLNTFLKETYVMSDGLTEEAANYPVVKSTGKVPKNNKVRIDLEIKQSPRVSFYFHHSKPNHAKWRIWRFEYGDGSVNKIKVYDNVDTGKTTPCNKYVKHTVIMDTATGYMKIYQEEELIWEGAGNAPTWNQELFFRHITNTAAAYKPVVTYNAEDNTKIESVVNPQYVYVKSLKMTTYTDTAFESVTPASETSVMTPKEAVFTFNKTMKKVEKATVYSYADDSTVDVTSSLIYNGNKIKVPYAFEDDNIYEVKLTGASDGLTSVNAETSFTTEVWNFSNIPGSLADYSPVDNTYYINEDFTNSDDTNLVTNKHSSWSVAKQIGASIVELEDGNKVLKLTNDSDFRFAYAKSLKHLDNTTALSYDVYLDKDAKQLNLVMSLDAVAMWQYGYYNYISDPNVPSTAPMTAGEWHRVDITISDETGKNIYVDGKLVHNTPAGGKKLSDVEFFRFKAHGTHALIDNLKLYLNNGETALTDVTPAYDVKDVKASAPLSFTYNEAIGDVSAAKLILKPNGTNEETVITNGNGMTVNVENYTVKVILDNALNADTRYGVELSGLKGIHGNAISPVKTRFSTVADDEWTMTDIETAVPNPSSKTYSFKLKHQGDAKNAQLITATYNYDGTLSNVVLSDVKSVGNSWTDFSATAEYKKGKTTKLFIWDSANGMVPVFNAILK